MIITPVHSQTEKTPEGQSQLQWETWTCMKTKSEGERRWIERKTWQLETGDKAENSESPLTPTEARDTAKTRSIEATVYTLMWHYMNIATFLHRKSPRNAREPQEVFPQPRACKEKQANHTSIRSTWKRPGQDSSEGSLKEAVQKLKTSWTGRPNCLNILSQYFHAASDLKMCWSIPL